MEIDLKVALGVLTEAFKGRAEILLGVHEVYYHWLKCITGC